VSDSAWWADRFGLDHPVLGDPSGQVAPFVRTGYPTYVVIGRNMTIQQPDMWPWSPSFVLSLL
jgi:hypothetical protein